MRTRLFPTATLFRKYVTIKLRGTHALDAVNGWRRTRAATPRKWAFVTTSWFMASTRTVREAVCAVKEEASDCNSCSC